MHYRKDGEKIVVQTESKADYILQVAKPLFWIAGWAKTIGPKFSKLNLVRKLIEFFSHAFWINIDKMLWDLWSRISNSMHLHLPNSQKKNRLKLIVYTWGLLPTSNIRHIVHDSGACHFCWFILHTAYYVHTVSVFHRILPLNNWIKLWNFLYSVQIIHIITQFINCFYHHCTNSIPFCCLYISCNSSTLLPWFSHILLYNQVGALRSTQIYFIHNFIGVKNIIIWKFMKLSALHL